MELLSRKKWFPKGALSFSFHISSRRMKGGRDDTFLYYKPIVFGTRINGDNCVKGKKKGRKYKR